MKEVTVEQIMERGITRLCHFTKSKNISHILGEQNGILSSDIIPKHIKDINDNLRLDNKKEYICCSIEYPNVFYLDAIRNNDKLFKEWSILIIEPSVITKRPCLFSPVNAATENGKYIERGRNGFSKLYSPSIKTNKKTIYRNNNYLKSCPTDMQAEVLVKEVIPKEYIKGLIVNNEEEGKKQLLKLQLLGLEKNIKIVVSSELFTKESYIKLKQGQKLREYEL